GLKPGQDAGDWRDSPQGLDGGTYPYDVNVALVPAALRAIASLNASGLLTPYQSAADRRLLEGAGSQCNVWTRAAPPLFRVHINAARAAADVQRYARSVNIAPAAPLAALHGQAVDFPALALDASGRPLPVMHSDEVFALVYGRPGVRQISVALDTLMRPFPAGLMTPVGFVVADPVYAGPVAQRRFSRQDYHGTVIWGWPEAALAAGLTRQLHRKDLPPRLRMRLARARKQLWHMISAASAYRGVELWSWADLGGRFHIEPFRPRAGEAEADAAQLWSTVSLALAPPGH
ncbi:MAG: hypothetical protein ACREFP_10715, partial [Acetobacteraceae bacterium]